MYDNLSLILSGGLVGNLPDLARHRISGNLYIINSKTILIEDFNYDGTAPGKTNSYYRLL